MDFLLLLFLAKLYLKCYIRLCLTDWGKAGPVVVVNDVNVA